MTSVGYLSQAIPENWASARGRFPPGDLLAHEL